MRGPDPDRACCHTTPPQAELVLRAEELREQLWGVCDRKMEEAEAERARVASDSFVGDHTQLVAQFYQGLAQVRLLPSSPSRAGWYSHSHGHIM